MSPYWSYLLAAVGVTGLWIAATRPTVGWWFNAYALVYARLVRRARRAVPVSDDSAETAVLWRMSKLKKLSPFANRSRRVYDQHEHHVNRGY